MIVTRIQLKNWRNFREADVTLAPRTYLIGANAAGKSNFLDVFRFLRTVAQAEGGGLQKAIKDRGGLTKLRSLHARRDTEVLIRVEVSESADDVSPTWQYELGFKSEGKGAQRVLITREVVWKNGVPLRQRPEGADAEDAMRLTQTHLEQINNNAEFRELGDLFASTTYLHLVPQLLKFSDEISGRMIESDPFGQGLLQRIARTPAKTREARLKRINAALAQAVPQFSQLAFQQDEFTGMPHLVARFNHWREHGALQREDQLSDGTLRLIGLLWALQEGDGLLLLEEPELSLNDAIVDHIPLMVDRVLRDRKRKGTRQVLITTHSDNLVGQVDDPKSICLLIPTDTGTTIREPDNDEVAAMNAGLNAAEVLLPKTRPTGLDQLGLF